MFYREIENLSPGQFKRLTGVKREVFALMHEVLDAAKAAARKHPSRGAPPKLTCADKLLLLLMYYREYRTMFHIGITYGISESRVCEIIKDTESILIKDPRFHLPGKKALLRPKNNFEVVLIDATESPVERPKKKQRRNYSGKKKRHTLKRRQWPTVRAARYFAQLSRAVARTTSNCSKGAWFISSSVSAV